MQDQTQHPASAQVLRLISALHQVLEEASLQPGGHAKAAGFLPLWPDLSASHVEMPPPVALPVLEVIKMMAPPSGALAGACFDLLAQQMHQFNWRQSYDKGDVGSDFLHKYGWVMLAGDGGMCRSDQLLITLLLLGPETHYPLHSHEPEELYQIIAGEVEIASGEQGWKTYREGDLCHHVPWISHELRTGADPVVMMAIWKASHFRKSRIDPL